MELGRLEFLGVVVALLGDDAKSLQKIGIN